LSQFNTTTRVSSEKKYSVPVGKEITVTLNLNLLVWKVTPFNDPEHVEGSDGNPDKVESNDCVGA
jgi:hypothetical protein